MECACALVSRRDMYGKPTRPFCGNMHLSTRSPRRDGDTQPDLYEVARRRGDAKLELNAINDPCTSSLLPWKRSGGMSEWDDIFFSM